MAQMVMGEPSSTKSVQIILVNLKHGCQRAEFLVLYMRGWTGGGGGTGIEGAESGVEGAESGVEGAGSGSRGGGKRGNCGRGSGKIGGRTCFFY